MYYITKEELENINRELVEIEFKLANLKKEKISRENTGFREVNSDLLLYNSEVTTLKVKLKELKNIIKTSTVVNNNDDNVIGIGTRFKATINFGDEEETSNYILTGKNYVYDPDYENISSASPLGKAVLNKKEKDSFKYNVDENIMYGVIDKIYSLKDTKKLEKIPE